MVCNVEDVVLTKRLAADPLSVVRQAVAASEIRNLVTTTPERSHLGVASGHDAAVDHDIVVIPPADPERPIGQRDLLPTAITLPDDQTRLRLRKQKHPCGDDVRWRRSRSRLPTHIRRQQAEVKTGSEPDDGVWGQQNRLIGRQALIVDKRTVARTQVAHVNTPPAPG